jgi:WhiB family redox-sensing transcriptional regulator
VGEVTRARTPRPHEVDDARRDARLLRALRDGGQDPAWRTRGACQSVDPELFFPAPSESPEPAVEMCHTCPVQGSCLAWALDVGDLHGVWGGTTARERRAMAVVWRGWHSTAGVASQAPAPGVPAADRLRRDPALAPAPAAVAPAAAVAAAGTLLGADLRRGAERGLPPKQRGGDELPEVGAVMDRAELLRLVRAT